MQKIVVDTGPIVALFRQRDKYHAGVVRYLRDHPCLLVTTWHVVTEAWHLLSEPGRLGMMRWIDDGGAAVLEIGVDAATRMRLLLEKYRDRPMDIADASLVLLAERLGVNQILTIDHADFDVYRLANGRRFVQVL